MTSNHREHTILLNRERVNKGMERMNSLPLSPLTLNLYALNSYQGLSALGINFFVCIKFDKGGNSLLKHIEHNVNIHSNL